jgi:hypothetical protein
VLPGAFDDYLDAVSLFWNEWIINYDFAHQTRLARAVEQDSRQLQQNFQKRLRRFQRQTIALAYRVEAWLMAHKLLVFLVMVAVLGTLIVAEKGTTLAELRFRLAWRFRRRDRSLAPGEATMSYHRFLTTLEKKGFRKPAAQTPREFALAFVGTRLAWPVLEFTRLYTALRFGQAPVSLTRLRALLEQIASSRQ